MFGVTIKGSAKYVLQRCSRGRFYYRFPRGRHVYLTFDDGPDPRFTPEVLDVLDAYDCRSTFFLIGSRVEQSPEVAAAIHARGHRIGLHTFTHRTVDGMTEHEFDEEIARNQSAIRVAVGQAVSILRPPRGQFRLRNLVWAARRDLTVVHYTITSNDWKATAARDVVDEVPVDSLRGGEILSFHDTTPHTVGALPAVLDALRVRGFEGREVPLWVSAAATLSG